jgi:hypothetical protein
MEDAVDEIERSARGQSVGTEEAGARGRACGVGLNGRADIGGSGEQAGHTRSGEWCGVGQSGGARGDARLRAHLARLVGWTVGSR